MTPTTEIDVGGFRKSIRVVALVDTGFDGFVSLPVQLGVTLGLELKGAVTVELADGAQHDELVFAGTAKLLGHSRNVDLLLTRGEETLIGTQMLDDFRLTIDFPRGKVQLKKSNPRRG
jgi:clan AA aspartic protease